MSNNFSAADMSNISYLVAEVTSLSKNQIVGPETYTKILNEVVWGAIIGKIEDQTDLVQYLTNMKQELAESIDAKTNAIFHYKGSVAKESNLPTSDEIGAVYNVEDTGANYAWNGNEWDKLSETIDLTKYISKEAVQAIKTELEAEIANKVNKDAVYNKTESDDKYLTKAASEALALNTDLEQEISDRTEAIISLENALTVLDTKVDANKTEADDKFLTNDDILEKADKTEINAINVRLDEVEAQIERVPSLEGLATEEYVNTKITNLVGTAPETLDTLEEIAQKLTEEGDTTTSIIATLGTKANTEEVNLELSKIKKSLNDLQKYVNHYLILTPEQEQQVANTNTIEETLKTAKTVTIDNGTVGIINIPEVTSSTTVTAPLEDKTSLELTSAKAVTLTNTNNNVVDLDITAPSTGSTTTVTLAGNYNKVEVENASIKINEGTVNNVIVKEDTVKATTINAPLGENSTVISESNANLTITNSAGDTTNLDLDAPEATVILNGQYNNVTSTVGENTLVINSGAHIKKLIVEKGNVIVKDRDINNRIDEVIYEAEYTVEPYTTRATTMSEINSGMQIGGKTIVDNDIDQKGSGIAFGIFASGNVELDLNGKTIKGGRSNTGLMFIRGTSNINIVGEGSLENTNETYGIWVSSVDAVVNIYSGNYIATTHCLYAENGTINVYGGTFKLTNEDKTFLLNCLDASYKSGKAKINVYGGKFYGFNPAASMSEPDGPVSFVAEGYHVVETTEDGLQVYEVVAD